MKLAETNLFSFKYVESKEVSDYPKTVFFRVAALETQDAFNIANENVSHMLLSNPELESFEKTGIVVFDLELFENE